MIRPTVPTDLPALIALADRTGMFKPMEVEALREVLVDYVEGKVGSGHRTVTLEEDGRIRGLAYWAPAAMTDRTWYLYWIAVEKGDQAKGYGGQLLKHAEAEAKAAGARLMLIETSNMTHYELTRRFYLKHHYEIAGIIKDYYADADDLVIFRKRLA